MVMNPDFVSPYHFVDFLNEFTEEGEIVAVANGLPTAVLCQTLDIKKDVRILVNCGCGAMGWGLPAAIGAAFASARRIVCLEGDGSLQLNIQELQTLVHYKLPIKLFIGNNGGYNSIKNTQDNYFNGFYVGANPESGLTFPNLRKIAMAYDIPYTLAYRDEDLEYTIDRTLQKAGPAICELHMDPNFVLPKAEI
jgi:acetolactate synthase-1/2/3 large subunit